MPHIADGVVANVTLYHRPVSANLTATPGDGSDGGQSFTAQRWSIDTNIAREKWLYYHFDIDEQLLFNNSHAIRIWLLVGACSACRIAEPRISSDDALYSLASHEVPALVIDGS